MRRAQDMAMSLSDYLAAVLKRLDEIEERLDRLTEILEREEKAEGPD